MIKYLKFIGILLCIGVLGFFVWAHFTPQSVSDSEHEKKMEEVSAMTEKAEQDRLNKIVNTAMKNTGKMYIDQDINFPLKPSWDTSEYHYRIGSLIDSNNGEDIIIIETKPLLTLGTGSSTVLVDEDNEYVKTYAISKTSDGLHCPKILKIVPSSAYNSLYEIAPECLTECQRLQQLIKKGGKALSKEDLMKANPTCAESFK